MIRQECFNFKDRIDLEMTSPLLILHFYDYDTY